MMIDNRGCEPIPQALRVAVEKVVTENREIVSIRRGGAEDAAVVAADEQASLTEEHRIVYRVSADRIDILQARYHYRACDKLHKERNQSFQRKDTPAPVGQVH